VLQSTNEVDTSVCNGSLTSITDNDMLLVSHVILDQHDPDLRAHLRNALRQAKQLGTEVLLTCFSLQCDVSVQRAARSGLQSRSTWYL